MSTWKDVRNFMESGESLNPVPTGMELVPIVGLSFVAGYPNNVLELQGYVYSSLRVELRRNPANQYDTNAIEVHVNDQMLGHIPKDVAARLAPVIDGGTTHEAFVYGIRVSPENPHNPGLDLVVGVKK